MNSSPRPDTAEQRAQLLALSEQLHLTSTRITGPFSTYDTAWREVTTREVENLSGLSRTLHEAAMLHGRTADGNHVFSQTSSAYGQAASSVDEALHELITARAEMAFLHRFEEHFAAPGSDVVRTESFTMLQDRLALVHDSLATAADELRTSAAGLDTTPTPLNARTARAAQTNTTRPASPPRTDEVTAVALRAPWLLPAHATWPGLRR